MKENETETDKDGDRHNAHRQTDAQSDMDTVRYIASQPDQQDN